MISSIFLVIALQQQAYNPVVHGVVSSSAAAPVREHRVAVGDTLSAIAPSMGESWQQLYVNNKTVIGGNPNLIRVGQVLHVGPAVAAHAIEEATALAAPAQTSPSPRFKQVSTPAPAPAASPAPARYSGGSGMQACIIARESGGNPDVWNASGHYGLYQFSASTWAGSGGNPADFGHASVAEQNQVFANAVAARGYSDWTPYDGC